MRTPMHMSMGQEFVCVGRLRGARGQGRRVRLLPQPCRLPGADARYRPVLLRTLRPHLRHRRRQGRVHASRGSRPGTHPVERRRRHADSRRGRRGLRQPAARHRPHRRRVLRRRRGRRRRVLGEHQRRLAVPAAGDVRLRGQRLRGRHAARGAPGVEVAVPTPSSRSAPTPTRTTAATSRASIALAKEAAAKAHRDRRPAFLNIKCCRYLEHVGIGTDWNWGYRDQATVERDWIARDALKVQRARLARAPDERKRDRGDGRRDRQGHPGKREAGVAGADPGAGPAACRCVP